MPTDSPAGEQGQLCIGALPPGQDFFTGYMQDVRIFNRKLDIGLVKKSTYIQLHVFVVNNYIVRPYRDVIVVTNIVTWRTSKAYRV